LQVLWSNNVLVNYKTIGQLNRKDKKIKHLDAKCVGLTLGHICLLSKLLSGVSWFSFQKNCYFASISGENQVFEL